MKKQMLLLISVLLLLSEVEAQVIQEFNFDISKGSNAHASCIAIDSMGRVLLAGHEMNMNRPHGSYSYNEFSLWRYLPNGSLDKSFGQGGQVYRLIGKSSCYLRRMAILHDGKILTYGSYEGEDHDGVMLCRHLPDGEWDTEFGQDGILYFDLDKVTKWDVRPTDMVVLDDGRVLIAGFVDKGQKSGNDIFLYRVMPDGSRDASFGENGAVVLSSPVYEFVAGVVTDAEGRILVSGAAREKDPTTFPLVHRIVLRRFLPNGQLDTTLGEQGKVVFHGPRKVYLSSNLFYSSNSNDIIISGTCSDGSKPDFFLLKVNMDKEIPTELTSNQFQVTDSGKKDSDYLGGTMVLSNGKILQYGCAGEKSERYFIARFNADLTPDEGFAKNGIKSFDWWNDGYHDKIQAAALTNNRFYLAGTLPRHQEIPDQAVLAMEIAW